MHPSPLSQTTSPFTLLLHHSSDVQFPPRTGASVIGSIVVVVIVVGDEVVVDGGFVDDDCDNVVTTFMVTGSGFVLVEVVGITEAASTLA